MRDDEVIIYEMGSSRPIRISTPRRSWEWLCVECGGEGSFTVGGDDELFHQRCHCGAIVLMERADV